MVLTHKDHAHSLVCEVELTAYFERVKYKSNMLLVNIVMVNM